MDENMSLRARAAALLLKGDVHAAMQAVADGDGDMTVLAILAVARELRDIASSFPEPGTLDNYWRAAGGSGARRD